MGLLLYLVYSPSHFPATPISSWLSPFQKAFLWSFSKAMIHQKITSCNWLEIFVWGIWGESDVWITLRAVSAAFECEVGVFSKKNKVRTQMRSCLLPGSWEKLKISFSFIYSLFPNSFPFLLYLLLFNNNSSLLKICLLKWGVAQFGVTIWMGLLWTLLTVYQRHGEKCDLYNRLLLWSED